MDIPSYSKVYNLGHKCTQPLLQQVSFYFQEKIDGSQFSFMLGEDGNIYYRSRGAKLYSGTDNKLFKKAVDWVDAHKDQLDVRCIYRGEAMMGKRHNHLTYETAPECGFVLFEIQDKESEDIVDFDFAKEVADSWGIPWAKHYFHYFIGGLSHFSSIREHMSNFEKSCLGGPTEGFVVKPTNFVPDLSGKRLAAKVVKEDFKENQQKTWKATHKGSAEIRVEIGSHYANEARFRKAVQHLDEANLLVNAPNDIGPLLKELNSDLVEEHEDEIKEKLWNWAKKDIIRNAARGFPEWYKKELLSDRCVKGGD